MSAAAAPVLGGRPVEGAAEEVLAQVRSRFGSRVSRASVARARVVQFTIDRADLLEVARHMKEALGFDQLSCVSAVEWPDRFESVYHLMNYFNGVTVQLHARIPKDDPKVASVCGLWNAANYHEREAWDLMGVVYEGHPNLERILLPADFKFHPLRKDFPQEVDRQYISRRKLKGGK